MMKNIIGADAIRLARLQIKTLQKVQSDHITLEQWERFNNLSEGDREARFGDGKKPKRRKGTLTISEADEEKILKNNSQFLTDTFVAWYNEEKAKMAKQSVEIVSPKDIDWISLGDDIDKDNFGEYTMNPDTVGIDWENIPPEKIKAFDFAEFVGRPRWELAKHIAENYSDKYHIPGIEYWKYLIENEDKIPKELKDGNYYYFFGSILRDRDGSWDVPSSDWYGNQWHRLADWLKSDWRSRNRAFLLEK